MHFNRTNQYNKLQINPDTQVKYIFKETTRFIIEEADILIHYTPPRLGSYQFGWGALSRWVPEKHTTRNFEIPACGTALVSERNEEICSFFTEEEAILYSSPEEMIGKMKYIMVHPDELEEVTRKEFVKMASGQFNNDYQLKRFS